jgi:hypothetical protein
VAETSVAGSKSVAANEWLPETVAEAAAAAAKTSSMPYQQEQK